MNVYIVHNVQKGCPILVTDFFFCLIETWFSALKIYLKNFNLQHKKNHSTKEDEHVTV